jgi:cytochrome c oxidase subunit 3
MSESSGALREPWPNLARQQEGVSFGVWAFLASEALFFGGLFLAYVVYRNLYPEAFHVASRETDLFYGTLNTAILMTSSLTMAVAARSASEGLRRTALWCLAATIALGCAFLIVKGLEYREDIAKNLVPGPYFALKPRETQLFFALYWIMTGVHAIHLTVGIGVVGAALWLLARRALPLETPRLEGIALYWHLVDIIWVILLPLLYLIGRAT